MWKAKEVSKAKIMTLVVREYRCNNAVLKSTAPEATATWVRSLAAHGNWESAARLGNGASISSATK